MKQNPKDTNPLARLLLPDANACHNWAWRERPRWGEPLALTGPDRGEHSISPPDPGHSGVLCHPRLAPQKRLGILLVEEMLHAEVALPRIQQWVCWQSRRLYLLI